MILAILARLFVVALDAIETTPVTRSDNLITLGTWRGGGLL